VQYLSLQEDHIIFIINCSPLYFDIISRLRPPIYLAHWNNLNIKTSVFRHHLSSEVTDLFCTLFISYKT